MATPTSQEREINQIWKSLQTDTSLLLKKVNDAHAKAMKNVTLVSSATALSEVTRLMRYQLEEKIKEMKNKELSW